MSTPTTTVAQCPTCGAKLARTNLSLCAYCGSPLELGAKSAPPDDEVTRRLARLRQHAEFQAKLGWNPYDRESEQRPKLLRTVGLVDAGIGAALAIFGFARGGPFPNLWMIVGGFVLLGGVSVIVVSGAMQKAARARPMLKRPAIVLDRRSSTSLERGNTLYFFTLRFDDGSEGEFQFQGRGTQYDPMANGATGIAYTRGDRLLEFARLN